MNQDLQAEYFIKNALKNDKINRKALFKLGNKTAKKFKASCSTNISLFKAYQKLLKAKQIKPHQKLADLLKTRPIRNLSGVAVITVLTKPYPCPGNCLFCPTQKDVPKSYLDGEPAVMRGILNKFDPYKQVKMRLRALKEGGHNTEKIELIVIGGTFSYLPKKYQTWFIKRCLDALNNQTAQNFERAKTINEKAQNRCIGLTLETRPDYIDLKEIKRMRSLGATRVEIGVQSIYDDILKYNKRGHLTAQTIKATRLLKNAGFKICYHLMLDLPKSTPEKDFKMVKEIFNNSDFQPDQIKIYPCVVIKSSELYNIWKQGKYKPYSKVQLKELIIKIKKIIPPYTRIIRLIRDIPATEIVAGNKICNLRQLIKNSGVKCQCTRCREARDKKIDQKDLVFSKIEYETLGGKEIFLQYTSENKQTLFAFLRLRLPSTDNSTTLKSVNNMALLRELHTYGQVTPIKIKDGEHSQHRGLGKKLIKKAEQIARENNFKKIAVISGIGVREYYRNLGYKEINEDEYLVKKMKLK